MGRFRWVLTLALFVAVAGTARAGIYCSLDQLPYPVPTSFSVVYSKLGELRAVVNTELPAAENVFRSKYLQRKAELETKEKAGGLTTDEQIDLSGIDLRLNNPNDALRVLERADHSHFLVLAHLAVAYEGLGLPEKGLAYEEKALEAWPAVWPNVPGRWNADQRTWYRRAERYYLELLRLRQQETRTNPSRAAPKNVDALFPRWRVETADGHYLVGGPRTTHAERLSEDVPPDSLQLVAQLMWWLPFDNRVFWLYGEMLNYRGDVLHAQTVLEEFFKFPGGRQPNNDMLRRHRRELAENVSVWQNRNWLFYAAAPRSLRTEPVASYLQEVGFFEAFKAVERLDNPDLAPIAEVKSPLAPTSSDPPSAAPPPPRTGGWLPDWRTVLVSFLAGMFFMALLSLQWRQWSRRRAPARHELTG